MEENRDDASLEVRTYFVRKRNALLARAEFSGLYVDYYLHQGQIQHRPAAAEDVFFKEALAALGLHMASRPWNESIAWTIHSEDPRLNVFVAGDNRQGTLIGQSFSEDVRELGRNLFYSDLIRPNEPLRRSSVAFEEFDAFRAVETFYRDSEQRLMRLYTHGDEDYVMVQAQPDCDEDWLRGLTDEAIRTLDQSEELSLLEVRKYRWQCGCDSRRMMAVLGSVSRNDLEGVFEGDEAVRIRCPRCGVKYTITQEAMQAFFAEGDAK